MESMLQKLGLKEDEAIIHPWINRALEKAQQKVEARNFDIRKNLLKFDDVMNDQRRVIFEQRIDLMGQENVEETVADMRHQVIGDLVSKHIPEKAYPEQWDAKGLHEAVQQVLNLDLPIEDWAKEEGIADDEVRERIGKAADAAMASKIERFGPEIMRQVEKAVLLQTLDHLWREHLVTLDHLRQVIGFRGYAQRDPLNEYKTEAFELFEGMLDRLREVVTSQLMRVEIVQRPPPLVPEDDLATLEETHLNPLTGENEIPSSGDGAALQRILDARSASAEIDLNDPTTWGKVQRNAPCPCGSGKKFKHCHGRFA
jgi:preprotein translocase subunit SecA